MQEHVKLSFPIIVEIGKLIKLPETNCTKNSLIETNTFQRKPTKPNHITRECFNYPQYAKCIIESTLTLKHKYFFFDNSMDISHAYS